MQNAGDVVGATGKNGMARMRRGKYLPQDSLQIIIGINHIDLGPMGHDFVNADFIEI